MFLGAFFTLRALRNNIIHTLVTDIPTTFEEIVGGKSVTTVVM